MAGRDKWSWATISAWAWGNSRVFDWLSRQPEVDSSRIAIIGHSRGDYVWTGAGDGTSMGDAANWLGGHDISGATFAVTNSVTTGEIGGEGTVTLAADSVLAFHFSSISVSPKFVVSPDATVSLPASGGVKVKISADEGLRFRDGAERLKFQLTTNGKFQGDAVTSGSVVLAEDAPSWVRGIGVEDGDLYVYARAPGYSLSVR